VTIFLAKHVVVSRTNAQVDVVGLESETSKGVLSALLRQPLQRAEVARALGHEGISGLSIDRLRSYWASNSLSTQFLISPIAGYKNIV
jgi:hypothetical protein